MNTNRNRLIILGILFLIVGVIIYFVFFAVFEKNKNPEIIGEENNVNFIPTFKEVDLDFVHSYDKDSYAFAGSSLIDVDGDGVQEVFIGGGEGQDDGLFKFDGNKFVNIIAGTSLTKKVSTGGALAIDADNDGDEDLYIARFDGLYFYENNGGKFTEQKLNVAFESNAVPLSISGSDINKDDLVDLYISTFKSPKVLKLATFNNPANRSNNVMLLNRGGNNFEDITTKAGLTYNQNTFQSTFVDLNGDSWQDLVLAPNTDKVVVFENKKNGTFEKKAPLSDFGFWMGLAVADVDNDGDQDLFMSNVGNSIPANAAKGDLRADQTLDLKWILLRNDGDFKFTNVTAEKGLADFEFAWGALFEDLNLDGLQDLLVVENYIKWPPHKLNKLEGRVLLQGSDGQFDPIEKEAGLENPYYGTSPLLSDFNEDGYPDVVFINFAGPSKAFLSEGGDNNYLKVRLSDNSKNIGAKVEVERTDGVTLTKEVIAGVGLMTDSSNEFVFGLGNSEIKNVKLTLHNGEIKNFGKVKINSVLEVK